MSIEKIKIDGVTMNALNENNNKEKIEGLGTASSSNWITSSDIAKSVPVSIKTINDSVIMSVPSKDPVIKTTEYIFSKREIKEMIQSIY